MTQGRGPLLVVVLAALAFSALGFANLATPGLDYDETNFVNAALGGVGDRFVEDRVFGIPFRIMAYIGALKSWLHAPVFAVFGVSPWTIRGANVLVSLGTLWLAFRLTSEMAGRGPGAAIFVILAMDPAFLANTRIDYGPTVLSAFFRLAVLLAFTRFLQGRRPLHLGLALGAALLGVFNKMDFLWFVAAFAVVALLLYRKRAWSSFRGGGRSASIVALAFLALFAAYALGPMVRASAHPALPGPTGWDRVAHLLHLTGIAFDGTAMSGFQFEFGPGPGTCVLLLPALGLLLLPVAALCTPRGERWEAVREPVAFLIGAGVVFGAIFATPQAGGMHHVFMLWPLPQLFGVLVLARIARLRRRFTPLIALIVVVVGGSQLRSSFDLVRRSGDPEELSLRFSPAIFELSRRLEELAPDLSITTDWGMGTQVFALAPAVARSRRHDEWPQFTVGSLDGPTADALLARIRGRSCAFLLSADGAENFEAGRRHALAFLDRAFPQRRVIVIVHPDGRARFEIHLVSG